MAQTKENLVSVLDQIQQNRKQMQDQVTQIETVQLPQMKDQLGRFDSVIASLQVSIADAETFEKVVRQQAAGEASPLAPPAGGAVALPAGSEAAAPTASGEAAGDVPTPASNGGADSQAA